MIRRIRLHHIPIALTAACGSLPEAADQVAGPQTYEWTAVSETDTDGLEPGTDVRSQGLRLSADELAIWNDPGFQRRFAESYIAETEIEPRLTTIEFERMLEIREYISADRLDKAVAALEKRMDGTASAVFDYTRAGIHFQAEEMRKAARLYEVAVRKYPKFRRAWKNLGLTHVRTGEFTQAVRCLSRVVELGGNDAVTFGLLGYCYANVDDPLAAESAYRMAALLDPETLDWKMGLARSFFEQKRYADAVALCDSLLEEQPSSADLWILQAHAHLGLGQPLEAVKNFELVDRLGKSTAASLNGLADICVNEGIFDLAVDAYVRAMGLSSAHDRSANVGRVARATEVLIGRGALEEAGVLLDAADDRMGPELEDEQRKQLLKLRARHAVASGGGEEEARVLEEIVALDPLDGEALILLGRHNERSERIEEAVFYFERAAGLEAHEAEARLRHAQLLVRQERYAEALPLLRRAQAIQYRENVQAYLDQVERISQGR